MEIKFDKNLYGKKAILGAVKAFKGLAKFIIGEEPLKYKVALSEIDKDVKSVIKDEFANYVLYLMKN